MTESDQELTQILEAKEDFDRLNDSGTEGAANAIPPLTTTHTCCEVPVMADIQPTPANPSFQPLPEHDSLNTAYLLWKIAATVKACPSGCWEWQAVKDGKGYGKVGHSKKDWLAHRLVFNLCVAPVSPAMLVCHRCDNPACVNPAHLFAGTSSDNLKDMSSKGRHRNPCPRGERKPAPKLSDDAVRDIRRTVSAGVGGGVVRRLAEKHGVSASLVSNVIHRHRYASVPDDAGGGQ